MNIKQMSYAAGNDTPDVNQVGLTFWAPLTDAGSGAVNLTLSRGTGSATFTRATTTRTILSSRLWGDVASGTAASYYSPAGIYLGYLGHQAVTNRVARSDSFGADWAAIGTPTITPANTSCGVVSLDLIGDDSGAALEGYGLNVVFVGGAVKAMSFHVAQGTSTSSVMRLRDTTAGADRLLFAITWSGGVPTATMSTGTLEGIDALGNNVYRIRVVTSAVTVANTNNLQVYPATDAALTVGGTGTINVGGIDGIDNAFSAGFPVLTTGAAATRNADVLTYPSAGNLIDASGTVFCKATSFWATASATSYLLATNASGRFIYNSGGVATAINNFDGTTLGAATGTSLQNRVAKLATTWSGATKTSYFDSVAGAPSAYDGTFITGDIAIGTSNGGGVQWNGTILDVRGWQRELSASQIASIR